MLLTVFYGQQYANGYLVYRKGILIKKGTSVNKAPYHGAPVTFSYDASGKLLTVWFHCKASGAKVRFTHDGEDLLTELVDMEKNEAIEYDLSECGASEYLVTVITNDGMLYPFTFILN